MPRIEFSGGIAQRLKSQQRAVKIQQDRSITRRVVGQVIGRDQTASAGHIINPDVGFAGDELADVARKDPRRRVE